MTREPEPMFRLTNYMKQIVEPTPVRLRRGFGQTGEP